MSVAVKPNATYVAYAANRLNCYYYVMAYSYTLRALIKCWKEETVSQGRNTVAHAISTDSDGSTASNLASFPSLLLAYFSHLVGNDGLIVSCPLRLTLH